MDAKQKIIELLNQSSITEDKSLSTSRIAGIVGIDYNYSTKLLEELLSENIIEKLEINKFTFWKIKEVMYDRI